jgi:uncharacterized protein YoxC
MQLVIKAKDAITEGASQVVGAVQKAKAALEDQVLGGIEEATNTVNLVVEKVSSISQSMQGLQDTLNPQALSTPLLTALQSLPTEAQGVLGQLQAMGERLAAVGESLGGVGGDVQDIVELAKGMPQRVADIRPDVRAVPPRVQSVVSQGKALMDKASSLGSQVQAFAGQLAPLQQRAQQLRSARPADLSAAQTQVAGEVQLLVTAFQARIDDTDAELPPPTFGPKLTALNSWRLTWCRTCAKKWRRWLTR